MFKQTFKNIDDILHEDAVCERKLDYIEKDKQITAELSGKAYANIIAPEYQWGTLKISNGKIDHNALTGDDLTELFPYLKKSILQKAFDGELCI